MKSQSSLRLSRGLITPSPAGSSVRASAFEVPDATLIGTLKLIP